MFPQRGGVPKFELGYIDSASNLAARRLRQHKTIISSKRSWYGQKVLPQLEGAATTKRFLLISPKT